jgi:hypothetical protein
VERTRLTVLPEPFQYTHAYVLSVLSDIRRMRDVVELSSVRFEQQPGGEFLYRIQAVDGRLWRQNITVLPADESHTFTPPDEWLLSEFILQRPIRDGLVLLVRQFGITSFVALFDYI